MIEENNNKHKYSSYLLVVVSILLFLGMIGALDTGDFELICNENNSFLKRIDGVWQCNKIHYGEAYYHDYITQLTINIDSAGVYYNISGFSLDDNYGIINHGNQREITKDALYSILGTMSFHGGNGGEYEVELFVNDVGQDDCAFFRTTSTSNLGDATLSCLKQLSIGDHLNIRVKDLSAPPQDIDITAFNFKIVEVG